MSISINITDLESKEKKSEQIVDQTLITFGRSKSCHIELPNPEISRRHFILRFDNGAYHLTDESSSYGTKLDGKELKRQISYTLDKNHVVEVPGMSVELKWDGNPPKIDHTTVVARNLLDELLQEEALSTKEEETYDPYIEKKTIDKAKKNKKEVSFIKTFDRLFTIVFMAVVLGTLFLLYRVILG